MAKWIWRTVGALTIAVYFWRLTRGALHAALSPDAITNIYRVYSYPLSMLLRANLLFYETSPFYRPFASAWYIGIFHYAGIDPRLYQAFNLLIMAGNAFLTYAVARRLLWRTDSCLRHNAGTAAWTAALLACYHPKFNGLEFDTGFLFDVLSYFFFFSAFLVYLRARQDKAELSAKAIAACSVLYICALNSKEIAVSLPLFLLIYEWLYHRPPLRMPALLKQGRGVIVTGLLGVIFVIGRATGADSLMSNPAYRPVFTFDRFMQTSRQFVGDLFLHPGSFTTPAVLSLWGALGAVAWLSRSNALRFAWFFILLSGAPVAFVEPRGASQYYLVLFGWALYVAVAATELSRRLLRTPVPAAVVILLLLYPYYKSFGNDVTSVTVDGKMLQSLDAQLLALHPTLPQGSHILLLNETDDPAWDTWLAAVRLTYRDGLINIDRARKLGRPLPEREQEAYDFVLDYRDGHLVEPPRPADPRLKPQVLELIHDDWSAVTPQKPARRGEIVMVKIGGLGATDPDIAAGQPFPQEPLAPVLHKVVIRVNGVKTETVNAFGWPQMVNVYRVDFRVPDATRAGNANLDISVRGVAAPPVTVPVR